MNNYQEKDQVKFSICNKLISRGIPGSSSAKYAKEGIGSIPPMEVNKGIYKSTDMVGISVNGARSNAVAFNSVELLKAITAGASIVKDNKYHTMRKFNTDEREVKEFLLAHNYRPVPIGTTQAQFRSVWKPVK